MQISNAASLLLLDTKELTTLLVRVTVCKTKEKKKKKKWRLSHLLQFRQILRHLMFTHINANTKPKDKPLLFLAET
jgi:hypothetical protein